MPAHAMGNHGRFASTWGRMDTRLRRPAKTGVEIRARSWLTERSDREMQVSATLSSADGVLIAEGEAALVILSQAQRTRLGIGA